MANIEPAKTDKELYDDWKPLIEGQQDAMLTVDERLEQEKTWIDQSNYGRGVSAGGEGDSRFPVERKQNRPVQLVEEEWTDPDNDF